MELDRKDLIDFAADVTLYVEKIGIAKVIDNFIERKSIKAEAQNETPNVNNNEGEEIIRKCELADIEGNCSVGMCLYLDDEKVFCREIRIKN